MEKIIYRKSFLKEKNYDGTQDNQNLENCIL
jgi:hypothetical protein